MAIGTAPVRSLDQWAPEEMAPGTMFPLETEVDNQGFPKNPFIAVFACPRCGVQGLITKRQVLGVDSMICGDDICSAEYFFRKEGEGDEVEYLIQYRPPM
jgi:hypothetical protein